MIFLGWLVQSCREAEDTSRRFVAAVRQRRVSAAYDLVSPELRALLAGDTDEAGTFALLQATRGDLGVVESGFAGTWPVVPFACFDGVLSPTRRFWVVASKAPDGWRVVELRSDRKPKTCEASE